MNQDGLMLDYLLGKLDTATEQKLEEQIATNPSLQEDLVFEANLLVALDEYVEESQPHIATPSRPANKIRRLLLVVSSVAALFFFAIITTTLTNVEEPTSVAIVKTNTPTSGMHTYLRITDFGYDQVIKSFSSNFVKPSWFELKNGVSG